MAKTPAFCRTPFHQNSFVVLLGVSLGPREVSAVQVIVSVGHRNSRVTFVGISSPGHGLKHAFRGSAHRSSRTRRKSLTPTCHGPCSIKRRLGLVRYTRGRLRQFERFRRVNRRVAAGMVEFSHLGSRRSFRRSFNRKRRCMRDVALHTGESRLVLCGNAGSS